MNDHLMFVLRNALFNLHINDEGINWAEVLSASNEQTVLGLTCDMMHRYGKKVESHLVFQSIADLEQIKASNHQVNESIIRIVKILNEHEINYCIIKGQIVGSCYPNPGLRLSGDIDLFFYDGYESAKDALIKQLNFVPQADTLGKHDEFIWNGVNVELHRKLLIWSYPKYSKYWNSIVANDKGIVVYVDNTPVNTLSPTLNALYIFLHLYHHLLHEGVGLRQFCDWAMWLHHYKSDISTDALQEHLCHLELTKAYRVLGAIIVYDLGLPVSDFPLKITEKDRKRSRRVLSDVMSSGNFGHNRDKIKRLGYRHSIQTALHMVQQGVKYIDLSPKEILCRFPYSIWLYLNKRHVKA